VTRALADPSILETFRAGEPLPPGWGVGIDERCVELPWALSHLRPGPERLLDAGSSLNHAYVLDFPAFQGKSLHIVTLAPERNCFYDRGVSYLYCDLRDLPVRDGYYDLIMCISTLEHVGCDNSMYTRDAVHREKRLDDFRSAMAELRRVLKPGGALLLTVPFGVYRFFGWLQQFDDRLLQAAIEAFGPCTMVHTTFYRYSVAGWQLGTAQSCADVEYVEWLGQAYGRLPTPVPVEPDLAAGARAVACVRLVK